jgi:hypothetical protein
MWSHLCIASGLQNTRRQHGRRNCRERPASFAILLKFIEAREALDADVAIGLSAMRLRRGAGITACAGRAGRPPLAKFCRPEEVRREPASGRLDNLADSSRLDGGNSCIDRGPQFRPLVRINAAGGDSFRQPIGPHGNLVFRIVPTALSHSARRGSLAAP